jgi:hypothetical protein
MKGSVNDDLGRMWKEVAMAHSKILPSICLQGQKNSVKNLSQVGVKTEPRNTEQEY